MNEELNTNQRIELDVFLVNKGKLDFAADCTLIGPKMFLSTNHIFVSWSAPGYINPAPYTRKYSTPIIAPPKV